MDGGVGLAIGFVVVIGIGLIIAFLIFAFKFYRKVAQGQALIINKTGTIDVTFSGGVVIPVVHKAEYMDISVKAIDVDRRGNEGLICQDNIRADIKVTFYVRVNGTKEDVLKVASAVGCARASSRETLEELFMAKFSEALKTVGKQMDFTELFTERDNFKEKIIEVIGQDLNGYKLEDVAIDYLEQTPVESLDEQNILDAQGIRKITELTKIEAIATNKHERNAERVIKAEDVETREKILELERQEADAEAKQKREIESIQAREESETAQVKAAERLKAEQADIRTAEELSIAEENKERQIEVAKKNKERTIAVEEERVVRDRELEATERERLVEIKRIEKDKAVEVEKKIIAEVIRERVAVEKTVAAEQEKIKDTVADATAERERRVEVIEAEREAEKERVKITIEAQAKREAAENLREEMATMAEAEFIEAEKKADAKKVLAEGIIAEQSAEGLASVKVREAEANAIEVQGKAEAVAAIEKHKAEAYGKEAEGKAEAVAVTEMHKAEAYGKEAEGTAEATAAAAKYTADAEGTEKLGAAEAAAMQAKFHAEAEGINEKAEAMKNFDGVGREHEEFKLELNKAKEIELAQIDVNRQIAEAQAKVMAEAMKTANIDVVGGGGEFLNSFFKSISLAKSIDGFADHSDVVKKLSDDGTRDKVVGQIKELVGKSGLKSEDLKNLTVSALLAKLALKGGTEGQQAQGLGEIVKQLGMDDLMALWLAK